MVDDSRGLLGGNSVIGLVLKIIKRCDDLDFLLAGSVSHTKAIDSVLSLGLGDDNELESQKKHN
jgi:hypothetical protein